MMVTVPHIAVASYPDALPFIYGIRHAPDFRVGELLAATPERCAELFAERETDLALVPAALVPDLHDADIVTEYCVGGVPASKEALLASDDALVGAWKPFGKLPCAFAVWAAHADTDPDAVETLQHALTYGLEHGYEAILESAFAADPGRAYAELAHFDYIFDNQKDKALKKFWNSGLKAVPRANPG